MEFADYIRIVKKNLLMIVVVTVLFGLAAGIVTARQDTSYQASTSIEIARLQSVDQNKVGYFQYDDFYATQVATTFSDNVVGWLASPAMVAEIFQKAGYDLPSGNLKDLGKVFTAKKNNNYNQPHRRSHRQKQHCILFLRRVLILYFSY